MPTNRTQHAYCSYCGAPFAPNQPWPRLCAHCQNMSFINPLPVAVVVQPVDDGVLLIQRAIEPQLGKWALPGGYIDMGENWQTAAARELWEETGLRTAPDALELLGVHSGYGGRTLIVVGRSTPLVGTDLPPFTPLPEVSQRRIVRPLELASIDIAFPLHRQMVEQHFASPD
ncbi:MAG: NUDIX domain-containing protein [Caldilineaceae bacterium]